MILVAETQNYFLSVAFILRKKQPFPLVPASPLEKCKILTSLRDIIIFLTRNLRKIIIIIIIIIISIFYQAIPPSQVSVINAFF